MPLRINLPPLTRILLGVLLALSVLTGALRYRIWNAQRGAGDDRASQPSSIVIPFLTVVPQLSIFYPWVFVTATLVEQNLFALAITAATIFYGGKYLERAWSSPEFAKFLLVVSVVPNALAFATYIVWFAIAGDVLRAMTTICGGVALQAGFLVAFKQLVPEHTVTIAKGIVQIRVKHFPALFLLATTLSGFIFGTDVAAFLAWYGFLSSWTFLRFYKSSFPDLSTSQQPTLKGDASETFAFAYFFPDPLHGPIATISGAIYNILVALRICTPFSDYDISAGNSRAEARGEAGLPSLLNNRNAGVALPGSARAEAERRRALALKALDQRLHAATSKAQSAGQATVSTAAGGSSVLGETSFTPEGHDDRAGGGGGEQSSHS